MSKDLMKYRADICIINAEVYSMWSRRSYLRLECCLQFYRRKVKREIVYIGL